MAMTLAELKAKRATKNQAPESMPTERLVDALSRINNIPASEDYTPDETTQIVSPIPDTTIIRRPPQTMDRVPASLVSGGTMFYTAHGGGTIIIDTTEYKLPLTTSDNLLISRIKTEYNVGALHCPIKMRKV